MEEDYNISDNFRFYLDEEFTLDEQDIERDYRDLIGQSSDTESYTSDGLLRCTLQNKLLVSKSSSSLRKIRFSEEEFHIDKLLSDIKYYYLGSSKDNLFYPFNDQLDYVLANYLAEFKTTKGNLNQFLSNLWMILFTEKVSYPNANK